MENNKTPGFDARKRKNLRVLYGRGDFLGYLVFSVDYKILNFCPGSKKYITGLCVFCFLAWLQVLS